MAWYYYSGSSIIPVPVGNGEVIAARPHTTIFIDPSIETTSAFRRLGRVLRRTGAPKGAVIHTPEDPISEDPVSASSDALSESIVEGTSAVSSGQDAPLVKKLAKLSEKADSEGSDAAADEKPKRASRRRRRA
jgi:hypothetical protein